MSVTDDLWHALCGFRRLDRERTIWVDALSVNQSDTSERSSQVFLMNLVYIQASSVEVWPGDAVEHIEVAIQFITEFATRLTSEGTVPSYDHLPTDKLPEFNGLLSAMEALAAKSWFERT